MPPRRWLLGVLRRVPQLDCFLGHPLRTLAHHEVSFPPRRQCLLVVNIDLVLGHGHLLGPSLSLSLVVDRVPLVKCRKHRVPLRVQCVCFEVVFSNDFIEIKCVQFFNDDPDVIQLAECLASLSAAFLDSEVELVDLVLVFAEDFVGV